MAEADLASWFVTSAVEAYGDRVLASAEEFDSAGPQAVGRELARLIFGRAEAGTSIPAPVAIEIGHAGSRHAGIAIYAATSTPLRWPASTPAWPAPVLMPCIRRPVTWRHATRPSWRKTSTSPE